MTEYVQARIDRLRAPVPPRRARPATEIPLPEPSDDVGPSRRNPLPASPDPPAANSPDPPEPPDQPDPRAPEPPDTGAWWGRAGEFVRSHLVVVGVIAALAVVLAGYAVLRARPLPLTLPAQARSSPSVASAVPTDSPHTPPGAATGTPTVSGSPSGSVSPVVVHVLGAVRRPGVVEVASGSRVDDAIDAAGGLRDDAAPDDLNLAQVLIDGQQVLIGTKRHPGGEVRGGSGSTRSDGSPGSVGSSGPTGSATAGSASLDLNTAPRRSWRSCPALAQ